MLTEMNGFLGGSYSGSFKGSDGNNINYSKVLILPLENSTEFVNATVDSGLNLSKLNRFQKYTFKCDIKGDKMKVVDVFELK